MAITIFLIVFWLWSIVVLAQQKSTWKQFAKRKDLRYRGGKMFESPDVSGAIEDYKITLFTSEHQSEQSTLERRLTSIEISLHTSLPISSAIASGGMVKIVDELNFHHEFRPDVKGWDNSYVVRSRDNDIMKAYLTDSRLRSLVKLMKIKNVWIILIFAAGQGLLRLDTPDPLYDVRKLDDHVKSLLEAAKILELTKAEISGFEKKKAIPKVSPAKPRTMDISDISENNGGISLQLEDED